MAQRAIGKVGLSRDAVPERHVAARALTVAVVLLVVGAPLAAVPAATSADASQSPVATSAAGTAQGSAALDAAATGTAGQKVDIVFVFDRTASANEDRYLIAREIEALARQLRDDGVDARYGLVTYNRTAGVEQPLTRDFDEFERAMAFPEAGSVENASDAILTATGMDFREDAKRIVVLVTDEDDDSSNATREAALAALSDVHFVAVSPASPYESSCAVHSPPCDNASYNELRTMAERVGGDWIAQSNDAATIVDAVADAVESVADAPDPDPAVDPRPVFVTTAASAGRMTAEVGDRVRFSATVDNVGAKTGTYAAALSRNGTVVAWKEVTIPDGESARIAFVHRFEAPGEYRMRVAGDWVGTVEIVPPRSTSVDRTVRNGGTAVSAQVTDAWANGTVTIPMTGTDLASPDAARFERAIVSIGDVNVTPHHDVDFDVLFARTATPPDGVAPLPDHVARTTYLTVYDSLRGDREAVTFEYRTVSNATTLYRYDAAEDAWIPLDRTAVNATGDGTLWRATGSGSSLYAVGVRQPAITATAVELEADSVNVGESTDVVVTLANEGAAAGTFNATLTVNGSVVGVEQVSVPANGTRTVVLTFVPERAGPHAIDVADAPAKTLEVEPATTASPTTDVRTTTDARTAADATTRPSTTRTRTAAPAMTASSASSPLPGLGLGVAGLALAGVALLARRRA